MSKILITGGAGFIGGALTQSLLANHEVDIVDSLSRGVRDQFLEELIPQIGSFYELDLLKESSWQKLPNDYDYIVHFAAIIGVRHVLERPYNVLRDNVILTDLAIAFAQRQSNLKKFLFASTSEVMAGSLIHMNLTIPTPESFPLALTELSSARTSYMLSKIYGEAMCVHSKLPSVIIRPHNIYGPRMGMSHVIPELLKKAYSMVDGDALPVASVNHSRAMCFIDDAIELIKALLLADDVTGTFNIGNENTEVTILDLAKTITAVVGKELQIQPIEESVGSPSRRCPNMKNTIEATGYKPLVSIREGVERTYQWYKSNVFEGNGTTAI